MKEKPVKPLISVIVPVYNAESYLRNCIESILEQDFNDFELILINDGSKDDSGSICDEMALKDQRIRVFHKKNDGVGSARNDGIRHSIGTYLCFVDSDDWLDENALKTCINALNHESYDLIQFGCTRLNNENKVISERIPFSKKVKINSSSKAELISFFEAGNGFSVWGKIIKKSVIINNNLFFGAKKRGEDIDFTIKLYGYLNSVIGINKSLYNYRVLYGIQSKYDPLIIDNHIENFMSFYRLFENSMNDIKVQKYVLKLYLLWFVIVVPINIVGVNKLDKNEKLTLLNFVLSNHKAYKQYKEVASMTNLGGRYNILTYIVRKRSSVLLYVFSKSILFLRKVFRLSS